MRKYALETDTGAGCENMHSVKIILSPRMDRVVVTRVLWVCDVARARPRAGVEISPLSALRRRRAV